MKSIILRTEEARQLLDKGKVIIRRVIKPQPMFDKGLWWFGDAGWSDKLKKIYPVAGHSLYYACLYGQPGDSLYVKETWRIVGWDPENGELQIEYKDSVTSDWIFMDSEIDPDGEKFIKYHIQCDEDMSKAGVPIVDEYYQLDDDQQIPTRWRPSIHMPRWASRADVVVKDVRVEQETEWVWVIELERQ